MRQLYLNDVYHWIRMMEGSLVQALRNLMYVCEEGII